MTTLMCGGIVACEQKRERALEQRRQLLLPEKKFDIGLPQQYITPGVHKRFRDSHGVWIVTREEGFLVVLSAVCPSCGCGTRYDSDGHLFICPCDNSRFDADGLVAPHSVARRSLERCHISQSGRYGQRKRRLIINPTIRYRQEENEWSTAQSMYYFEHPRLGAAPSSPQAAV